MQRNHKNVDHQNVSEKDVCKENNKTIMFADNGNYFERQNPTSNCEESLHETTSASRKRSMCEYQSNHTKMKIKKMDIKEALFCSSDTCMDNLSTQNIKKTDKNDQEETLSVEGFVFQGRLLANRAVECKKSNTNSCKVSPNVKLPATLATSALSSVVTVPKTNLRRRRKNRKSKRNPKKQSTTQNPPQIKAMPKVCKVFIGTLPEGSTYCLNKNLLTLVRAKKIIKLIFL